MVAYRPALLFPDAFGYLSMAHQLSVKAYHPVGYSLFLWPLAHLTGSIAVYAAVQHGIGLLLAVLGYLFLLRRGLPSWGATLAVLPVLVDPLQLVLEHYILSDTLFEALLVGACLLVLGRERPGPVVMLVAGLLIAFAGITRGAGTFVLAVFVVAALALRLRWTAVLALLVGALVPLTIYSGLVDQKYDSFSVSPAGPLFLYARLAPVVHCENLTLLPPERILCPSEPVGQRPDSDWYMWGEHSSQPGPNPVPPGPSPRLQVRPWHGMTQLQLVKDFDKRVLRAEPAVVAQAMLADAARGFAPVRTNDVPGFPSSYWLFADHNWSLDTFPKSQADDPYGRTAQPTLARFLTGYRKVIYLPGPLAAGLLVAALLAVLGVGRARRSGDRVAVFLLAATCAVPLLTTAALSGFSWRYQIPQIPLIPMAGALAIAALARGRASGRAPTPVGPATLDRWSAGLVRRGSSHPGLRRADERGHLQVLLALAAGVAVAVLAFVGAVGSGWVATRVALPAGILVGLLVAGTLLAARWRSRRAGELPPAREA